MSTTEGNERAIENVHSYALVSRDQCQMRESKSSEQELLLLHRQTRKKTCLVEDWQVGHVVVAYRNKVAQSLRVPRDGYSEI